MVYTVQDRNGDHLKYIGSLSTFEAAQDLVKILEQQDWEDGIYETDKYKITKRGICFSDYSEFCGKCTNCVCMADDPETECPARKEQKCS